MRCMKLCCFLLSIHKGIIPAPLTCTPTMPSLMTCSTFDKDKLILTDLQHCSCLNAWQSCLAEIKTLLIMVPLRRSHIVLENEHKCSLYFNKGRNARLFNSNINAPLKYKWAQMLVFSNFSFQCASSFTLCVYNQYQLTLCLRKVVRGLEVLYAASKSCLADIWDVWPCALRKNSLVFAEKPFKN